MHVKVISQHQQLINNDVCTWMIAVHELNVYELNVYVHTYIDECTLFRHLLF